MKGLEFIQDKAKNNMDELTQLMEPFECKFNDALAKFPERFTLDPVYLMSKLGGPNLNTPSMFQVLQQHADDNNIDLDGVSTTSLDDYFKFEVAENTQIDLENGCFQGEISVVRCKDFLNDEQMMDSMVKRFRQHIRSEISKATDTTAARLHEIADVFGLLDQVKSTSRNIKKRDIIVDEISELIENHKIRIRDVELGSRFGRWIAKFLRDGNLAAKKNIATLKIMSHSDQGIYSIHGEELV